MILCHRFLCRAALSVLFAGAVAEGAAAVERRMTSPEEQAAWGAVGRLNVTGQGYCTATLVAADIVLTAAHCVMNRRTGRLVRPEDLHFLPGFRIGSYLGHGRGARIVVMPGYNLARKTVHLDLALVKLRDPMPPGVPIARVDVGVDRGFAFTLLSYGLDRSQLLSAQDGCQFEKRQGSLILTTCEGLPGISGAPVFQMVDGRPVLVAVASSIVKQVEKPIPRGNVLAVEVTRDRMNRLLRQFLDAPSGMQAP